ncbi:MarR family winged helix-turn-helix transcriptional regulator [Ohtaekwangia sp.]|uniref:MarR family winged helix-turn-helix transcriptional regulator n=1 Tax=Ohtaekwangia sp. TaxID=2066019 RepID=UPI002F92AEB4
MQKQIIASVREFNRFYTAILGVVNDHILEGDHSLTEARIIYELNSHQGITAREIKEKLRVDEGYMSRIVNQFQKKGILRKKQSKEDKRVYLLELTLKGKRIAREINRQSDAQVENLVKHLSDKERERLVELIVQVQKMLTP